MPLPLPNPLPFPIRLPRELPKALPTSLPASLPRPFPSGPTHTVSLEDAVEGTRTGDLWLFRGGTVADRVIQTASNAPVNHVGMAVVLEDLPPLMWHAELGRSLRDYWTGEHQRGVQLHDLREAVTTWQGRYGQRAWLRQLTPEVGVEQEEALLRTIARLNGVSFPSTAAMAWRWLRGRDAYLSARAAREKAATPEAVYCAEVVGVTLEEMGILDDDVPMNWYDPGRFWSGDSLPVKDGWSYGVEVGVLEAEGNGVARSDPPDEATFVTSR